MALPSGILLPSHSPLPWNLCTTLPCSWHLSRSLSHMTPYSPLSMSVLLNIIVRKLNSLLYKIAHHLHHSTAPQCQHYTPACPLRYSSHLNFTVPFCRTSRYLNSFFPSTIRLWNNLPSSAKNSTSLSYFKFYLNCKL